VSKISRLKAVAPKASLPSKPKMLLFGKPGVGKTWFALDFPAVYYIDTEGGAKESRYIAKLEAAGGVYFGPEHGATTFADVMEQIRALASEKHPYRTVVIDSVSKLFSLEIAREAERLASENKKNEFGADKKPAVSYMRQLVSWLVRLDMNAILIAHHKAEWGRDATGERVEIGDTFDCWEKLEYELDLALNIVKSGPSRIARVKKSRLGAFPDGHSFPFTFGAFADLYGRDIIEGEVQTLELASTEQVAEVTRLLGIVKLADGTVEKWFSAANVSAWDEMDAEKVAKIINHLKEKLV
jgi:hypothetical protein